MKEPKWIGLSINERYVRELEAQVAELTADLVAQLAQAMSIVRTREAQVAELTTKYNCAIVQDKLKAESIADYKAQVAELRQAVSLHWEQKLDAHVESADRRLWALIDKGEI